MFVVLFLFLSVLNVSCANSNPWDPRKSDCVEEPDEMESEEIDLKKNSFDGLYLGLSSGKNYGNGKISQKGNITTKNSLSIDGYSYGIILGYGQNLYDFYIGLEVDGHLYNSKGSSSFIMANGHNVSSTYEIQKNRELNYSLRIGKNIKENFLIYAKIGLSDLSYRMTYRHCDDFNDTFRLKRKNNKVPYIALGIDYALTNSIILGTEYSFGKKTYFKTEDNMKMSLSSEELRGRILYKF